MQDQETEYTFNQNAKNAPSFSALASFSQFVWNSNTNEFLGRDSVSWGKNGKKHYFKYLFS